MDLKARCFTYSVQKIMYVTFILFSYIIVDSKLIRKLQKSSPKAWGWSAADITFTSILKKCYLYNSHTFNEEI